MPLATLEVYSQGPMEQTADFIGLAALGGVSEISSYELGEPLNLYGSVFDESETRLRLVFDNYLIEQQQKIRDFLRAQPHVMKVLIEALPKLAELFGGTLVELELHNDPEEGFQELFASIRSTYDVSLSLKLLNEFDNWFLSVLPAVQGKLNFTIKSYDL
ncbi:MAG: hypothetical protein WC880_05225 [Candidatus Paceibacterota bacterium]